MQQIISQHTERYRGASKLGKGLVVRDIYEAVQSNGARFLRRVEPKNGSAWKVVEQQEALQKVSHGIRDFMASDLYSGTAAVATQGDNSDSDPEPSPSQAAAIATLAGPSSAARGMSHAIGGSPSLLSSDHGLAAHYHPTSMTGRSTAATSSLGMASAPLPTLMTLGQQQAAVGVAMEKSRRAGRELASDDADGGQEKLSPTEVLRLHNR